MTTKLESKTERIMNAFDRRSLLTTAELVEYGVSREYLRQLVGTGRLERAARGVYRLPDADVGAFHSIAAASRIVPNGVICLLSALRIHGLTTQAPFDVWIAIESGAWHPRITSPALRVIRPRGAPFSEGICHIDVEGITVRVYSPAKTVADCFKYRNKIGLDIGLEALREALNDRRIGIDDLWRYAKVCRVTNVMRPYLEAME